jgi:hypothetical protein
MGVDSYIRDPAVQERIQIEKSRVSERMAQNLITLARIGCEQDKLAVLSVKFDTWLEEAETQEDVDKAINKVRALYHQFAVVGV